ncbi:gp6-like head-tail connector protein [Rhodobacter aestuarii]|uniref:Phage gp6-like head-tail connector protein n=1 Tax=Rhodobacter aestuarii TaxID=453582 RepID=A0A1N7K513_9RHOB|nr:head-tail connector protein [Rhodobacter aestuarii]PTV95856.1 gp6-like head-tail connector protein [Rhodobacter aestuarii]SIS56637.1 Phage gp6-like head-tail connector protein [Rhodobacter aestuarii]
MTLASIQLSQAKLVARVDGDDEDAALMQMLEAAQGDVLAAANYTAPEDGALPDDLAFAIYDQCSMLYDNRGGATERDRPLGLSLAASRICARYRGVSLGEVPE